MNATPVINAELFAVINFLIDACLLSATGVLSGGERRPGAILAGAALGAVYAFAALWEPRLFSVWCSLPASALMVGVALRPRRFGRFLVQWLTYGVVATFTAGVVALLGQLPVPRFGAWGQPGTAVLLAAAGLSAGFVQRWWQGVKRTAVRTGFEATIGLYCHERWWWCRGRLDSGNDAMDPLSGRPVSLITEEYVRRTPALAALFAPALAGKGGGHVVPVQGLNESVTLLPARTVTRMVVKTESGTWMIERPLLAVFAGAFDPDRRYALLLPAALVAGAERHGRDAYDAERVTAIS